MQQLKDYMEDLPMKEATQEDQRPRKLKAADQTVSNGLSLSGPKPLRKMGRIPEVKVAKFVKAYLATGNLTESILQSYPNMKKRTSARSYGNRLIKHPDVQRQLQKALKRANLDTNELVGIKKDIIHQGASQLPGKDISPELLNKTIQELLDLQIRAQEKGQDRTSNVWNYLRIDINSTPMKEIEAKASDLKQFFGGILEGEVLPNNQQEAS